MEEVNREITECLQLLSAATTTLLNIEFDPLWHMPQQHAPRLLGATFDNDAGTSLLRPCFSSASPDVCPVSFRTSELKAVFFDADPQGFDEDQATPLSYRDNARSLAVSNVDAVFQRFAARDRAERLTRAHALRKAWAPADAG